jgi:Transposase Tn5 dimerisation domain
MIIAWRVLFLTYIGRYHPSLSCELFYEEVEWKAVYIIAYKKPPPNNAPSIGKINKIIAGFGGFLNRKSDKAPGIKSMWIGLQRLRDFTLPFKTFNSLKTYG